MSDFNIVNSLHAVVAESGWQTGLVCKEGRSWQSYTFDELQDNCNCYASTLRERGVRRGDRVMLMVRPSMEFICLTFALFQLGAVVILIDPGMGYKNLLRCIGAVHPDILVGIPRAILFSRLFAKPFATVRQRFSVGGAFWGGEDLLAKVKVTKPSDERYVAAEHDLAAIIFTTGSTGPPKGVQYTHGIFHAQLGLIRDYYGIGPGDVDQPGFPLFALFATALGAKAVIPEMDPTRPSKVDPEKFTRTLVEHRVSYSFGSPAIWNVVSRYCIARNIVLPVKKILMAGAPVSGELIGRVQQCMPPDGEIFTPYGATESLPIASIEGREVTEQTWESTRRGRGTCVGRPLPGVSIRVIETSEESIEDWSMTRELPPLEIGEIVVKGPVVTRAYDNNDRENSFAKIIDRDSFWHRMGDMGYMDEQKRLWFCGRKAHRVMTRDGVMYTIPCEAIFNEHPKVMRSALVGLGQRGRQTPVLVVELAEPVRDKEQLTRELRRLAASSPLTRSIETFLVHKGFPVDIRHNAKIFREKLAAWAGKRVQIKPG